MADRYLGKQRSELDWIRNGFRGWNIAEGSQNPSGPESLGPEDQRNRLAFIRKYWVDHQQEYFRRAAARSDNRHENLKRAGHACLGVVAVLFGILVVLYFNEPHFNWLFFCRVAPYREVILIVLEAALALAALLHHFNDRMGYSEYAKQYQRMDSLFARGSELLGLFLDRQDYHNAALCVKRVGQEALTENGDWVLLRRERPLEIPHP